MLPAPRSRVSQPLVACRGVLAAALCAALPAQAQQASLSRTLHAARRTSPIQLDGRLDEPAWLAAQVGTGFLQSQPEEGAPSSVGTRIRVLWDDESLYIGFECDDDAPATATLSRRDRQVDGDSVWVDLDTTLDRRTAYHFQVFAAGQQLDGLHFNDTDLTTDWDGAWESAVASTPKGWSVEMRIPLRILRIPEHAREFGFNAYRVLSRRHEEDQWRFRPKDLPGDISQLGILDGVQGIHQVHALELRPYLAARLARSAPASAATARGAAGACSFVGLSSQDLAIGCAGMDLRYGIASDLALVATVNPDFGQVEADQRLLNLSTLETFFPEKRPFFLDGMDLFQSPLKVGFGGPYSGDGYQIFYSRRIGRAPPAPPLADGASLLYEPAAAPVAAAAKLSGTVGGTSVGLLTALEPRVFAQLWHNGRIAGARAAEARNSAVLRVRTPLGDSGFLGFLGTSSDPLFAGRTLGLPRPSARVGSADLVLFDAGRAWTLTAQAVGSRRTHLQPEVLRDGTAIGASSSGWGAAGRIAKSGGWLIGSLTTDYLTPRFDTNDLGFMPRANLFRTQALLQAREVHPNSLFQRAELTFTFREIRTSSLDLLLERDGSIETYLLLNSFWDLGAGYVPAAPFFDDRELGDGTPLERQANGLIFLYLDTDTRKPPQLGLYFNQQRSWPRFERQTSAGGTATFRPLPALEGTLGVAYNETAGTLRQIREATALPGPGVDSAVLLDKGGATAQPREYLLAAQQTRSISTTLRATWAFTPRLTLQAYTQLFIAGIAYGTPFRAIAGPGRQLVRLDALAPARPEDRAPAAGDRSAALDLNLILRWEWRTGSTLYLVYAHQANNDLLPQRPGLDLGAELAALSGPSAIRGDALLLKIDLLTAL